MAPPAEILASSRSATFGTFVLVGFAMLSPVAWYPDFIERLGVTFAVWGGILGFSTVGAILPLVIAGRVLLRFGSRAVLRVSLVFAMIFLILLGFLVSPMTWGMAQIGFSFSMAFVGVSVNTHAVAIQSFSARPVVIRLHAGWSVGALMGALLGGISTILLPVHIFVIAVACLTLFSFELLRKRLLSSADDGHEADKASHLRSGSTKVPYPLWILVAGLFAALFPEIAIFEWSVVFAHEALEFDSAFRVFPFASFMVGMIAGRLVIPIVLGKASLAHVSHHSVAAAGSGIAALCLALATSFAPTVVDNTQFGVSALTGVLWLAVGLGLSCLAPAYFAAAAHVPYVAMAWALSFMQLITQILLVWSKVLMGFLAEGFGVDRAFLFPVAILAIGSFIAFKNASLRITPRLPAGNV